jgi:hypothetical protein
LLALSAWAAGFNHKAHASLKLKCTYCHKPAEKADRAQCRTCHVDLSERMMPPEAAKELPEFVFFSHAKHAAANVDCVKCHGNAEKREFKMKWCLDCHKQTKAATTCNTCHELGQ